MAIEKISDMVPTTPNSSTIFPVVKSGVNYSVAFNTIFPASSTDNALARYDGTTGLILQNSLATCDDTGILTTTQNVANSHVFTGDTDTGTFGTAANQLSIKTNNIDRVVADALGNVLTPTQPAFTGFVTTTQNNVTGDATFYLVINYTEIFDVANNFNATTGIFTAPVTGKYMFFAAVNVTGCTIANAGGLYVETSNRVYASATYRPASNLDIGMECACVADMDVGDQAYMTVATNGEAGKTNDLFGSSLGFTRFGGMLIG